jgi:drug/metabolite transporter (DMT)-like permease
VARRFARADPAGLLYGAIVSAAALATASIHNDDAARVATAAAVVLVVYWMADLYVHALSVRFDGDTRGLIHRLVSAAEHKASVLKGGVPGIVTYLGVYLLGVDSTPAAFTALGVSVVLLTVAGYLGARQAGTPARAAMIEGAGAGLLGVVIVVAKSLLH